LLANLHKVAGGVKALEVGDVDEIAALNLYEALGGQKLRQLAQ
jgi:hypothetical protein